MPISDPSHNGEYPLDESINKLETFIDETDEQTGHEQVPVLSEGSEQNYPAQDIPILDDVIDNEEQPPAETDAGSAVTEEQLLGLIDNLEHRLTSVMETLVNSMKDEMIDSISEEVKTQMDNYQQKEESKQHSGRTLLDEPDYSHLDGYRPYRK